MYTRTTEPTSVVIQLPTESQPIYGLPISMTVVDTIFLDGEQIGHAQHRQQQLIPSDVTPELLASINEQLAMIGYQLTPISEE